MTTKTLPVDVLNPFSEMGRDPKMGCPLGWVAQWAADVKRRAGSEESSVVVHGFDGVHATYEHALTREEEQAEQIERQAAMIHDLTVRLDAAQKAAVPDTAPAVVAALQAQLQQAAEDRASVAAGLQRQIDDLTFALRLWKDGKLYRSPAGEVVRVD